MRANYLEEQPMKIFQKNSTTYRIGILIGAAVFFTSGSVFSDCDDDQNPVSFNIINDGKQGVGDTLEVENINISVDNKKTSYTVIDTHNEDCMQDTPPLGK